MRLTRLPRVEPAKKFPDFFRIRRDLCRYSTWEKFADAADVGVATVYKLLREDPITTNVSLDLRDQMARHLRFDNWWELVVAWHEDDVMKGMAIGTSIIRDPNGSVEFYDRVIPPEVPDRSTPGTGQENATPPQPATSPLGSLSMQDWLAQFKTKEEADAALAREWAKSKAARHVKKS